MGKKRRHRSPSESDSSVEICNELKKKRRRKSSNEATKRQKLTETTVSPNNWVSSADSSSSSFSSSSDSDSEKRKRKKTPRKEKKSKHKKKSKKKEKKRKHKKSKKKKKLTHSYSPPHGALSVIGSALKKGSDESPTGKKTDAACSSRMLKPLTKEEWEKQQSVLHRVYDPETGRNRLIRGDGEIVEEIVSKDRHREINKQATLGDGFFYQMKAGLHK